MDTPIGGEITCGKTEYDGGTPFAPWLALLTAIDMEGWSEVGTTLKKRQYGNAPNWGKDINWKRMWIKGEKSETKQSINRSRGLGRGYLRGCRGG